MKNINWNDVQEATERRDLPVGGYVAGICKATDEPAKERLNIEWEVVEASSRDTGASRLLLLSSVAS